MWRSSKEQLMSDVNIMLLGSTGSGKSASGNTIIGVRGKFKEGFSPSSVTRIFQSAQTEVDGQRITVIDTVGLSDTDVKKITDAQTQIEQILQNTNLDVILLVIKLGETFTKEKSEAVKWIHDNFGTKVSKHTIVLFTHGDKLDMSVDKYLSECEKLRSVVDQCSGGFHVFKNRDDNDDGQCQVNELLKKIESLTMMNGNRRYTEKDYAKAQKDLLIKKCATGAAVGGGAGALGGAAGGAAIAAKVGTAVLTAGKAAAIGATGGAALLAVAAGFGVYFIARKYIRSSNNSETMKSGNKKQK